VGNIQTLDSEGRLSLVDDSAERDTISFRVTLAYRDPRESVISMNVSLRLLR
jgi:hypothetical protein